MAFRQSGVSERFEHRYILCKSLFYIVSPMRSTDGYRRRNPWKSRARIRAASAQGPLAILFREEARVFSLLDARTEVAAWANDDITLVCGIKDGGERAERYSRRIYSALARVRVYLIHESVLALDSNFQGSSSHTLCLLIKYSPIYLRISFFNGFLKAGDQLLIDA